MISRRRFKKLTCMDVIDQVNLYIIMEPVNTCYLMGMPVRDRWQLLLSNAIDISLLMDGLKMFGDCWRQVEWQVSPNDTLRLKYLPFTITEDESITRS